MKKKIKCFLFLSFVLLACELQASKVKKESTSLFHTFISEMKDVVPYGSCAYNSFNTSFFVFSGIKFCRFIIENMYHYYEPMKKRRAFKENDELFFKKIVEKLNQKKQIIVLRNVWRKRQDAINKLSWDNEQSKKNLHQTMTYISNHISKLEDLIDNGNTSKIQNKCAALQRINDDIVNNLKSIKKK